jgi:excisionase family DNA binding protein
MPSPGSEADLLTLTEVADRLGVHYMTAYRYLRTGRLEGTKHGTEWRVRDVDVARFEARASTPPSGTGTGTGTGTDEPTGRPGRPPATRPSRRRIDWAGRAEERMLGGDEAGAWSVIESAMAAGMSLEEVYLDLLTPALRSIGDRWATTEVSVADEHLASAITLRLVGRLGPRFARRGRKRGTIIAAAPDGDTHSLPVALFADLLRGRGFRVMDLGGDVPRDSLAAVVAGTGNLLAVCLGSTTLDNEGSLVDTIASVRAVSGVTVLAGGQAITDQDHARAVGADDGGMSTAEALQLVERLPRLATQPT